jgi:hypothetical protein
MKKLTKRQDEVIRTLGAVWGRRLVMGKGGYWTIVDDELIAVQGLRGVAPIVVTALHRSGLIEWHAGGYQPTAAALVEYRCEVV